MSNPPLVSLIVPIYKKENIIVENISLLRETLSHLRYPSEIIAVIDGAVDQSEKKLKAAKIPTVRIIAYEKNQGKSYAIRKGMAGAKGEYVMFMDAGREIDASGVSMLLEHMDWYNADIVVGSKRHPASQVYYPLQRRILSDGYYWIVRFLFGIKVRDTQAGIKVFRRPVVNKILPRLVEKKFAGDLEILVAAKANGFGRIYEAPIKLDYRLGGISNAATIRSSWGIFVDTLAIWYRANILKWYAR